jgi:hypothetical protein
MSRLIEKAKQIFGQEFNEKLLRIQLSYFQDISYQEEVEYLQGFTVDQKTIQKALIEFSLVV